MSEWLRPIVETVIAEFSDLRDVREITRVTLRLLVAATLGALLGLEREVRGKSAGLRTHMLVCIGAAVFVMIPQLAGVTNDDMTRVMQGVITGIGFLGAGAILKREDANAITGLTTAAGIWMTAAIGMAAGWGRESTAILSTLLALATLSLGPLIVDAIASRVRPRDRTRDRS